MLAAFGSEQRYDGQGYGLRHDGVSRGVKRSNMPADQQQPDQGKA